MREVSLAILDVALNSIDALAKLICISVLEKDGLLSFTVTDDGCGMSADKLAIAMQRGVSFKGSTGLGLALLSEETAECCGEFKITSQEGVGTAVFASYAASKAKLGDLGATFVTLVDEGYDVVLKVQRGENIKMYDTRELKSSFGVAKLQSLGALRLIREDINQNN